MKKLYLATVATSTQIYTGGDDVHQERVVPVYAHDRDEVASLVRDTLDTTNGCGDRTSVLSISVEEPIGTPD